MVNWIDMKVILLQDVAKLGRRFSIVEVPDGYGINKLIPKGLAKPATPENVKAVQAKQASTAHSKEVVHDTFTKLCAALAAAQVTVAAPANSEGRLFQALKADAIAAAMQHVVGMPVMGAQIVIAEPIKAVGEHTVTLTAGAEETTVIINVTPA